MSSPSIIKRVVNSHYAMKEKLGVDTRLAGKMTAEKRKSKTIAEGENGCAAPSTSDKSKQDSTTDAPVFHIAKILFILGTSVSFIWLNARWWEVEVVSAKNAISKYVIPCSSHYMNTTATLPGCDSRKCGGIVMDDLFSDEDIEKLLSIAKKGLSISNKTTGRTIFNLQSGILEHDNCFVNITNLPEGNGLFTPEDYGVTRKTQRAIQEMLAKEFQMPAKRLYPSQPSYFRRITPGPMNAYEEQNTVLYKDMTAYFPHFTAVLHLGTNGRDVHGGRLIFGQVSVYQIVEAKKGRLVLFRVSPEKLQYNEKVHGGQHYTFVQSFSCNNATSMSQME